MKKIVLSLIVLVMTTVSFAQNTLVAVLSHETNVQMFYGPSALVNAVEAAVSGDVITLSAGRFTPCNITKGITIRGIGAEGENITQIRESSSYAGTISINIPELDENNFTIEGLDLSSTTNILGASKGFMAKCITGSISFNASSSANLKMVNCNVSSLSLNGSSNLRLSNCIVNELTNASNSTSKADVFNCYLRHYQYNSGYAYRCSFVNSILINTYWGSYYIPENAVAMNCLFIELNSSGQSTIGIDCFKATVPEVFASYENVVIDARYSYKRDMPTTTLLSEEAKVNYLGTDGKEVGIYGGQYPYDLTPTYPRITTLNVAKQATADNKLSVEIEVTAAE